MAMSLLFFSFLYKSVIPLKVSIKDSFAGALTFVGCFMAGKSFYWVYHLYSKDGLSQAYGNFYTMVIATFWIYFLMSSFFYGACVASLKTQKMMDQKMNADEDNSVAQMIKGQSGEEPPPLHLVPPIKEETNASKQATSSKKKAA
jgi:membrane protein